MKAWVTKKTCKSLLTSKSQIWTNKGRKQLNKIYSLQLSNGYYIKTETLKIQKIAIEPLLAKKTDQNLPVIEFKDITHVNGAYPIDLNPRLGDKNRWI